MTKPHEGSFGSQRLCRRSLLGSTFGAASLALSSRFSSAQTTAGATEPWRVVIAFPPGGTSTASMQPLIEPLGKLLGGPVELEYKPGAGGDLAGLTVARAVPDGHTLLFGHAGPLAINPHLTVLAAFNPHVDLVPIAQVIRFPIMVCAHTKLGVKTVDELASLGQKHQLVVGSSGNGSIQHLAGEAMKRAYRINTLHVPFAGGGPLQEALMKGALDVLCETGSNVVKHIAEGRLIGLGVMSDERLAIAPEVPTFAELGHPELNVSAWFGMVAPTATADGVQKKLSEAVLTVLKQEDVQTAYRKIGGIPSPLDQASFRNHIGREYERWGTVIHEAGIKPIGTDRGIGMPR